MATVGFPVGRRAPCTPPGSALRSASAMANRREDMTSMEREQAATAPTFPRDHPGRRGIERHFAGDGQTREPFDGGTTVGAGADYHEAHAIGTAIHQRGKPLAYLQ